MAAQVLKGMGIRRDSVREQLVILLGGATGETGMAEEKASPFAPPGYVKKNRSKSKTPVLDNFSRDLSQMARENKLDPVIGRGKEIERVIQILSRRTKNNPVLIGDPGVGKLLWWKASPEIVKTRSLKY